MKAARALKVGARYVKRLKVVRKSSSRPTGAKHKATDVADSTIDLSRATYLTVPETRDYLRLPSNHAVYMWAMRHQIPKCHVGRSIRFFRRDLDRAVQPKSESRQPVLDGGARHAS